MVGIEHKANIFARNQQKQGPEDERHGAQDILWRERHLRGRMGSEENLPQGVEDGGPNIAINDPAGCNDEQRKGTPSHRMSVCCLWVGCATVRAIRGLHHCAFQEERDFYLSSLLCKKGLSPGTNPLESYPQALLYGQIGSTARSTRIKTIRINPMGQ